LGYYSFSGERIKWNGEREREGGREIERERERERERLSAAALFFIVC